MPRTESNPMRPQIPPQIVRILLLSVAIVGAYVVARHFLTPPSFGQYGHYRGDALEEIAARDPFWAGKKACVECHSDHVNQLAKGDHKTLSCEGCHGPARAHADNPDVKLVKPGFGACVRCHEANPSRPKWLRQIASKKHYSAQKCIECHVPHQPSEVP